MRKIDKLDCAKLLGFDSLIDEAARSVDLLRESCFEAKLGAKVGAEAWAECEVISELLGSSGETLSKAVKT